MSLSSLNEVSMSPTRPSTSNPTKSKSVNCESRVRYFRGDCLLSERGNGEFADAVRTDSNRCRHCFRDTTSGLGFDCIAALQTASTLVVTPVDWSLLPMLTLLRVVEFVRIGVARPVTRQAWGRCSEIERLSSIVQRELSRLERRSEMEAVIRTVFREFRTANQELSK